MTTNHSPGLRFELRTLGLLTVFLSAMTGAARAEGFTGYGGNLSANVSPADRATGGFNLTQPSGMPQGLGRPPTYTGSATYSIRDAVGGWWSGLTSWSMPAQAEVDYLNAGYQSAAGGGIGSMQAEPGPTGY